MIKETKFLKQAVIGIILLQVSCTDICLAQNNRISDYNRIGWYNFFGTFNTGKKTGIHTDFQWRRSPNISSGQQNLLRVGFNYLATPKLQLRVGYAYALTFAYGDIPINAFGREFGEHRTWQMATLRDQIGKLELSHRFMLEQRWIGRYSSPDLAREDERVYSNRLRYMFRCQLPLKGTTFEAKTPYLGLFEEVMIGFGKNVNANVFDQNRLGILLGYVLGKNLRLEAGLLSQIVQLGRMVGGQPVFQYNSGPIINLVLQTDLFKKQ
jgi:hypothetical protein